MPPAISGAAPPLSTTGSNLPLAAMNTPPVALPPASAATKAVAPASLRATPGRSVKSAMCSPLGMTSPTAASLLMRSPAAINSPSSAVLRTRLAKKATSPL